MVGRLHRDIGVNFDESGGRGVWTTLYLQLFSLLATLKTCVYVWGWALWPSRSLRIGPMYRNQIIIIIVVDDDDDDYDDNRKTTVFRHVGTNFLQGRVQIFRR